MNIKPVIMAGGEGSRLWPLSQSDLPKQFIKLIGDKSLFQLALKTHSKIGKITVITNVDYKEIVTNQAMELMIDIDIILEPARKNTASCAILAAIHAKKQNADAVLLIPSDLHIENIQLYILALYQGIFNTISSGNITIFGITPTNANAGYGYIEASNQGHNSVYNVNSFIEKPPLNKAQELIKTGLHFWNSGITIFKPDAMLDLAKKLDDKTYNIVSMAYNKSELDQNIIFVDNSYKEIIPNSLDQAFLEQAPNLSMIKADFGWHDLGGWNALWEIHAKDHVGNATIGNVALHDTANSYISSEGKITAVVGVNDIIVVNTPTATLISHKSRAGEVKTLMEKLTKYKNQNNTLQNNRFCINSGLQKNSG